MKICGRVGPGFLTAVEFLHRKVAWNAEGFSWTHDPKHTHWQWLMGLVSTARRCGRMVYRHGAYSSLGEGAVVNSLDAVDIGEEVLVRVQVG